MRVLVTRPEEDARRLGEILAARGVEAIGAPLLMIDYIDGEDLNLDGVQALLFTSANGVRAFARRSARRELPALCVGDATAREARAVGFEDVRSADGDVDDLARLALKDLDPARGDLFHPAGSKVAGDLAGLLRGHGFSYRREVLYTAAKAESLPEVAHGALDGEVIDGVLLYSPRTAQAFVQLAQGAGLAERLKRVTAYCLSPAVADAVAGLEWAAVRVAPTPDQDALLAEVMKDT